MFDTHGHLNFSAFKKNLDEVVKNANEAGVNYFVVPGTDSENSKKAVEIAQKYDNVYAAVGIHPHHIFEYFREESTKKISRVNSSLRSSNTNSPNFFISSSLAQLKSFLSEKKVVAIGEVGIDRHYYQQTKYENYQVDESFIDLQKKLLEKQIELAIQYDKSLILHNREAKKDVLEILNKLWDTKLEYKTVFHCCEPDMELLEFAKIHKMFIGVDGDVTYRKDKQEFIKKVPLEILVLETDSPLLLPEPLRSQKKYPNEPKNLKIIAEFISHLRDDSINQLIKSTTDNARRLFRLPK